MNLSNYIRDVQDFPNKDVIYKDITPLLQDKQAFKAMIDTFADYYANQKIDLVLGTEARGFLLASAVAYALGAGLVIARKPGKLPYTSIVSDEYHTEYSTDILHIHKDSISPNQNVLIIDDVLATGGTARAASQLVKKSGGNVAGFAFLIELSFINGRQNLIDAPVHSLISY
ncbi:MAG: adenine phosphoribosyltransferase [Gammaproteobacteria bacterium]|nr:adenine phosphoribosyltransferase [Gammaproteobacteria bacterium]